MAGQPWGGATPEINATLIESGSTSATWAAASSAWMGLASATLAAMGIMGAQMMASLTSVSGAWSATSEAATPPFLAWLGSMAGIAFKQAAICAVVAESYGVARSSMIPSMQAINNRVREAAAEASNVFGQNTPLIGELNSEYMDYTVQNAGIGTTYGEVITTATLPVPIPPPPPLSSVAKTAGVAADGATQAAQLVTQAGGGQLSQAASQSSSALGSGSSNPMSSMSGAMGSVSQVFQAPMQMLQSMGQSLTSPLQSLSSLASAPMSMFGSNSAIGDMLGGGNTGNSFAPTLAGANGLPLGANGLGAGGSSGMGLGGGMGMGGLGSKEPTNRLTSTSAANNRTSVLSGISNAPAQAKLVGAMPGGGAPMGGAPGASGGARTASARRESSVLTYANGKVESTRRKADGEEQSLFT